MLFICNTSTDLGHTGEILNIDDEVVAFYADEIAAGFICRCDADGDRIIEAR